VEMVLRPLVHIHKLVVQKNLMIFEEVSHSEKLEPFCFII
jgi:hypothetical protein